MPLPTPQSPEDAVAGVKHAGAEIKAEFAYDASVVAEDGEDALDAVDAALERQDERIDESLGAIETRMYQTDEAVEAAGREAARRLKAATDALRGR